MRAARSGLGRGQSAAARQGKLSQGHEATKLVVEARIVQPQLSV